MACRTDKDTQKNFSLKWKYAYYTYVLWLHHLAIPHVMGHFCSCLILVYMYKLNDLKICKMKYPGSCVLMSGFVSYETDFKSLEPKKKWSIVRYFFCKLGFNLIQWFIIQSYPIGNHVYNGINILWCFKLWRLFLNCFICRFVYAF